MSAEPDKKLERREFMIRATKTAAAIGAAGVAAKLLYTKESPSAKLSEKLVSFNDFSVPSKEGQVLSVVKNADRIEGVNKAIELLGGIERFVSKGDTVVIKPNVAFATPAMLGATANPELVAEVVRLCYSRGGAKKVIVADNPINDPASCFRLSGIGKAATEAGAKVVLPKADYFKYTTLEGGELIVDWPVFYAPFEKADKVIGISPVKDHQRSGASMSMKNWYGLLGGRRNIFHQNIHTIISELPQMIKPTFVILDGTNVMMTNGPTGGSVLDLKRKDTIIASTDLVAADSYGAGLLDMKVSDLPYITKAEKAGVGTTNIDSIKPKIVT